MKKITKIYFTTTISILGTYILSFLYIFLKFSLDINFLPSFNNFFSFLSFVFLYILWPLSALLFFAGFYLLRKFKEQSLDKKYIRISIYLNILIIALFFASTKASLT